MKRLQLNAKDWKTKDDFYNALFSVLQSPPWHGRSFNALRDSITVGQINGVEPPYTFELSGVSLASQEVQELVKDFCSLIKEFRAQGYDVDASCDSWC